MVAGRVLYRSDNSVGPSSICATKKKQIICVLDDDSLPSSTLYEPSYSGLMCRVTKRTVATALMYCPSRSVQHTPPLFFVFEVIFDGSTDIGQYKGRPKVRYIGLTGDLSPRRAINLDTRSAQFDDYRPDPRIPTQPYPQRQPTYNIPQQQGRDSRIVPHVVITQDLLPTNKASQISIVTMSVPSSKVVYCVSEEPAYKLMFSCPDCNDTYFEDLVARATTDMTAITSYPSIKLESVRIDAEQNGKTLVCLAFYNSAGEMRNVTAAVKMNVQYLAIPEIVDENFRPPVVASGNRFFLTNSQMRLSCVAHGNPVPSSFSWFQSGAKMADGQTLTVDLHFFFKTVECRASNGLYTKNSEGAEIDIWELNKRIPLSCRVRGRPAPVVRWYQQISPSVNVDARCTENSTESPVVEMDVDKKLQVFVRPPMLTSFSSSKEPDAQRVDLIAEYCANPAPHEDGIYWQIDGEKIPIASTYKNFRALRPEQNSSYQSCYRAVLQIDPLTDQDLKKRIELHIQNIQGLISPDVSLEKLIGTMTGENGGSYQAQVGLAVGLSLAVILVLVALSVGYLYMQKKACFSGM
ncbi:unnamed protein product [Soboliphyme baturini]|uniref:Ig-like domain-containing protein n=1 Tax=Soboliphyme baturini TaxID=241478 RepID=A0A183IU82_9BILA|nr:unnamed protein product [Soboliphyme baturini]